MLSFYYIFCFFFNGIMVFGLGNQHEEKTTGKDYLEFNNRIVGYSVTQHDNTQISNSKIGIISHRVYNGGEPLRKIVSTVFEGRIKKPRKLKIGKLLRIFIGLKLLLSLVLFPFTAITAKLMSWKAVVLNLVSFLAMKIVFFQNLIFNQHRLKQPVQAPSFIIIHGSSGQDMMRNTRISPKIYI